MLDYLYDLRDDIHNAIIVRLLKKTHIYASVVYALLRKMPVEEMEFYLEIYKESLDKEQD